jgi:hypothetical protein
MRRRKLLVALAGLAVVGAALAGKMLALELRARPIRITRENYHRIRYGMSRARVEAILGGPPGDYSTHPVEEFVEGGQVTSKYRWLDDSGAVHVWFDEDRVRFKWRFEVQAPQQTRSEYVLWQLKHVWHRWFPE